MNDPLYRAADPLGGLTTVSQEHHEIHSGCAFTTNVYASMAASATTWHIVEAPTSTSTDKYCHFKVPGIWATGEVWVDVYENPGTYSGGNTATCVNCNRNSTETPNTVVVASATVSYTTTATYLGRWVGGGGGSAAGRNSSIAGFAEEFVLKPSTVYGFKITNENNAATTVNLNVFFYEEDNL